MNSKIDFDKLPSDPEISQQYIEKTFEEGKLDRELGSLGKFFGSGKSIHVNIAGLVIVVLLIIGFLYTACSLMMDLKGNEFAVGILEFWGFITPLITLSLGFIFGKKDK